MSIKRIVPCIFSTMLMLLILSLNPLTVYANNLILKGDANGLTIAPVIPGGMDSFFNIERMTPGDELSADLIIKNTADFAFTLNIKVEDTYAKTEIIKLIDQLEIEVSQNNNILTNFPAKGGEFTFKDSFKPGSETILQIKVILPGAETNNDYQNKKASLRWIFTASRDTTPPTEETTPPTEETPPPTEETRRPRPPRPSIPTGGDVSSRETDAPPTDETYIVVTESLPAGRPTQSPSPSPLPSDDPEPIEIIEDKTPEGVPEMPKTGEASLLYCFSGGMFLIGTGLFILKKK